MDVRNSKANDAERGEQGASRWSLWSYLMADVDPAQCTGPLAAFCFMTGYMYVFFPFPSNFFADEPLSQNSAMRFPSQPSSYGVVFKPATSYRYATPFPVYRSSTLSVIYIVSIGPCSSLRRSPWFPRPYIPQSRSTSPMFVDRFQPRSIRWQDRGPDRVCETHLAHRWYSHSSLVHDGCCTRHLEERPVEYCE
jgi:hypothetical protein